MTTIRVECAVCATTADLPAGAQDELLTLAAAETDAGFAPGRHRRLRAVVTRASGPAARGRRSGPRPRTLPRVAALSRRLAPRPRRPGLTQPRGPRYLAARP